MTETLVTKINPKELPVGAELEIHTQNSVYTLRVHEDGMTIQGGNVDSPLYSESVPFIYHNAHGERIFADLTSGRSMVGVVSVDMEAKRFWTSRIEKIFLRDPQNYEFINTRVADEIQEVDLSKLEIGTSVLASTKHNTYMLKITESPANKDYPHVNVKIIGGKRFPESTDFIYLYARVEDHKLPSRIRIGFSMHGGVAPGREIPLNQINGENKYYVKARPVRIKPIRHIEVLAPDVNNVTPFRPIKKVR